MDKQYRFLVPFLMGLMVALGMYIGTKYQPATKLSREDPILKIKEVLNAVETSYLDSVGNTKLVDDAITGIFDNLDPHSIYIPLKEVMAVNEQLTGKFEGIGIEFSILKDTIIVVDVIAGGPSEMAGIQQGDKILKINNEIVTGKKFKSTDVIKRLKGPSGSQVKMTVLRRKLGIIPVISITRGTIPLPGIPAVYMVTDKTGYIKLSDFAENTYNEFLDAIYKLEKLGMNKLIIDLEDNPGGYLNTAVSIADEFFNAKELLVYTRGLHRKNEDYFSTNTGSLKNVRLLIMINESSASASEILAGAMQDHDRALILGRRSFGKGLVQEQISLRDKSAIRLTVARYYTPSGRCIQKDYHKNKSDYYLDLLNRYEHGELTSLDSNKFPKEYKYRTSSGRLVYGGGGIMPDVFVPLDTLGNSEFLSDLNNDGIIYLFAISYMDQNMENLKASFKLLTELEKNFNPDEQVYRQLVSFAKNEGIKVNTKDIETSKSQVLLQFKAWTAKLLFGNSAYYQVMNHQNPDFIKAVEVMENNRYWNKIFY